MTNSTPSPIDSTKAYDICLASGSPRRALLLRQIGLNPLILPPDVDETILANEAPKAYVERLAIIKAQCGWQKQLDSAVNNSKFSPLITLGSDTSVVIGETILGKPRDKAQGLEMLAMLSGKTHQVYTSVAVVTAAGVTSIVQVSDVTFTEISAERASDYWETGEPHDKAGSYGIQAMGALFVQHISGSFTGVMGLPLFETGELLKSSGISVLSAKK